MPRTIQALERQGPSDIPYIPYNKDGIIYPESDGKPMADNTEHFNWIVKIKENLEALFADNPDVFVAGDLLWYPVEGDNKKRIAPDALVAIGRPKGHRGSYIQWEEDNIAPQVVFEVMSPKNTKTEMAKKLKFYRQYGVKEYYLYDPDNVTFGGWLRSGEKLLKIKKIQGWISPLLKVRFELTNEELLIYRPDGEKFLSFVEMNAKTKEYRKQAEIYRKQTEMYKRQREKIQKQIETRKRQKEQAEQAENKAKLLSAKLKELGIPIDDL